MAPRKYKSLEGDIFMLLLFGQAKGSGKGFEEMDEVCWKSWI